MSKEGANERISRRDAMPEGKRKSHIGIIIVVLLMVCLLGGGVIYLLFGNSDNVEQRQYNAVVTPDNVEEIIAQMKEEEVIPPSSYEVKMNTIWDFPDGNSSSSNAYVENVVENQKTVFFTIALSDGSNKEIYRSPFMAPGSHLENIKLDDVLDAGTHEAVITYHLVDDDYKETSSVSVKITLKIKK